MFVQYKTEDFLTIANQTLKKTITKRKINIDDFEYELYKFENDQKKQNKVC